MNRARTRNRKAHLMTDAIFEYDKVRGNGAWKSRVSPWKRKSLIFHGTSSTASRSFHGYLVPHVGTGHARYNDNGKCSHSMETPDMPELSRFYGIIVRMYLEAGGSHHLPHMHAYYQNEVAQSMDWIRSN